MNFIEQMFAMQKQLNDATNGTNWQAGLTSEMRQISWYRCIYMETAEAIDSFNWKHWKDINSAADWDNIKVELVDIWHFIMSEAIVQNQSEYANKYLDIEANSTQNEEQLIATLEQLLEAAVVANNKPKDDNIRHLIDLFFTIWQQAGLDVAELYKRYVVKNQLNSFRQKHGYKNGTYNKNWGKVEDNVVAFKIMDDTPNITPDELYQQLESAYQKLK